jgi:hypothetical protein
VLGEVGVILLSTFVKLKEFEAIPRFLLTIPKLRRLKLVAIAGLTAVGGNDGES